MPYTEKNRRYWNGALRASFDGPYYFGALLQKGTDSAYFGAFFTKKGTIFQNGSQRALFWLRLFSQCTIKVC